MWLFSTFLPFLSLLYIFGLTYKVSSHIGVFTVHFETITIRNCRSRFQKLKLELKCVENDYGYIFYCMLFIVFEIQYLYMEIFENKSFNSMCNIWTRVSIYLISKIVYPIQGGMFCCRFECRKARKFILKKTVSEWKVDLLWVSTGVFVFWDNSHPHASENQTRNFLYWKVFTHGFPPLGCPRMDKSTRV